MNITVSEALKLCTKLENYFKSGKVWHDAACQSAFQSQFTITRATSKEKYVSSLDASDIHTEWKAAFDKYSDASKYLRTLKVAIINANQTTGIDILMAEKRIVQIQSSAMLEPNKSMDAAKSRQHKLSYDETISQLTDDNPSASVQRNVYSEDLDRTFTAELKNLNKRIYALDEEITKINHTTKIEIDDSIMEFVDVNL